MKRFLFKILFFLCFGLSVSALASYTIDPYNVMHWNHIRNNGIEPNKNYIKTKYILANPDKYNGLMFGSSRVGSIHVEKIPNYKIYNMTYSAGTPQEQYQTLKTFLDNDISFDIVYLGVDSYSYTENPDDHHAQGMRAQYQFLEMPIHFIKLYFTPSMVRQSLPTILKRKSIDGYESFYSYGWWADYNIKDKINWKNAVPSMGGAFRMDETLQEIENIKQLCLNNGIQLVVFTNPMYEITYTASVKNKGYLEFLRKLASITDYYNFSGLNDISTNQNNYIDTSHYNAKVGDLLIDIMCKGKSDASLYTSGFGWYVTKNNVEELIQILSNQYQK